MSKTRPFTLFFQGQNHTVSLRKPTKADNEAAYALADRIGIDTRFLWLNGGHETLRDGDAVYYAETPQGPCVVTIHDAENTGIKTLYLVAGLAARHYYTGGRLHGPNLRPEPLRRLSKPLGPVLLRP